MKALCSLTPIPTVSSFRSLSFHPCLFFHFSLVIHEDSPFLYPKLVYYAITLSSFCLFSTSLKLVLWLPFTPSNGWTHFLRISSIFPSSRRLFLFYLHRIFTPILQRYVFIIICTSYFVLLPSRLLPASPKSLLRYQEHRCTGKLTTDTPKGTQLSFLTYTQVHTPLCSYLLGVVATQGFIRVGAADQELTLAFLGQDSDVVLAFVL